MRKKQTTMDQEYVRKDHVIKNMAGKVIFTGMHGKGDAKRPSINAAKRESRRIQGNSLGRGLLRVAA